MQRFLSVVCLAVTLSLAADAPTARADVPIPEMRESIVLLTSARYQSAEGRLLADAIAELREQSPTFNEMIQVLGASRVLTFIKPVVHLRTDRGFIGETRFFVGPLKTVAIVSVVTSRDDLRLRREALTHELAHIVEVACMGPLTSGRELYKRIQLQVSRFGSGGVGAVIETRFPERTARVVLAEMRDHRAGGRSQLGELLMQHDLSSCPATLPGRDVIVAQRDEPAPAFTDR